MIQKFLEAQSAGMYQIALREVKAGKKCSHWMWYIFPQLKGLGHSFSSIKYAINSFDEAKEFLSNRILRRRLLKITRVTYRLNVDNIETVFGQVDTLKFHSCMTLFALATQRYKIFKKVLKRYFNGTMCEYTLNCFTQQHQ